MRLGKDPEMNQLSRVSFVTVPDSILLGPSECVLFSLSSGGKIPQMKTT